MTKPGWADMWADRLCQLAVRLHLRRPETALMRRAREALGLQQLGFAAYRQRMRREHPQETEAEIDERVRAWRLGLPPDQSLRRALGKDDDGNS